MSLSIASVWKNKILSINILKYFLFFLFFTIIIFSISYFYFPVYLLEAEDLTEATTIKNRDLATNIFQAAGEPDITAEASIIIDYDSGSVLWEKNARKKLYPASTTKMMTAILAIEKIEDLDEVVRISPNAAGRNNSFFKFNAGDEISLMDLLKSALICSHNNATIALAEYVSGSEIEFLELMNKKAVELGAYNTYYQNTNGLDANYPYHLTTAEDLAIIANYCLDNELFRKIIGKKIDYIRINGEIQPVYSTNILLFFDYIKGIKTGFTNNAGYCQVLYSEREDLNLITVVLNSDQGKREEDILKLINWANDNYSNLKIIDSEKIYKTIEILNTRETYNFIYNNRLFVDSYPEKDYEKLINVADEIEIADDLQLKSEDIHIANLPLDLPLKTGQKLGTMDISINKTSEEEMELVSRDDISEPLIYQNLKIEQDNTFRNLLIFLITFYFLVFIFIIIKNLFLGKKGDK